MISSDRCPVLLGAPASERPAFAAGFESLLAGRRQSRTLIQVATGESLLAYRALRREVFVGEQQLFTRHDLDDADTDTRTVVLVARTATPDGLGDVLGGVRISPVGETDLGWWRGSRLAVAPAARAGGLDGVGAMLIRAACATAESLGALRFDADVQVRHLPLFTTLGFHEVGRVTVAGREHAALRWPIGRIQALAAATKNPLGQLLAGFGAVPGGVGATAGGALGGAGFVGDDGAPVPGSDLVAACDAIVPAMVERDPEWAGWCGVLVNLNDLAAMGAAPVGLLDAVAGADAAAVARVLAGVRAASEAWAVPVLGGHTQLGAPASLAITALGRTADPVPAGGGSVGDEVRLSADLGGDWRPGYGGRQWDSSSRRSGEDLRRMGSTLLRCPPAAAKDVSMAGLAGTLGMLAEASGCGAELEVAAVPRPVAASVGDWFTCFPGFGMLTAAPGHTALPDAGPATTARCGRLTAGAGVTLVWPDGERTTAVPAGVTGLGPAGA